MNTIAKANTILSNTNLVNFFEEVAPEWVEQVEDMVRHYNEFAQCAAPDLYMDEGDYMDATDNEKECEWAIEMIKESLEALEYAFRRYGPIYFANELPTVSF